MQKRVTAIGCSDGSTYASLPVQRCVAVTYTVYNPGFLTVVAQCAGGSSRCTRFTLFAGGTCGHDSNIVYKTVFSPISDRSDRQTDKDRKTDRQTDGQTDRQTDRQKRPTHFHRTGSEYSRQRPLTNTFGTISNTAR